MDGDWNPAFFKGGPNIQRGCLVIRGGGGGGGGGIPLDSMYTTYFVCDGKT